MSKSSFTGAFSGIIAIFMGGIAAGQFIDSVKDHYDLRFQGMEGRLELLKQDNLHMKSRMDSMERSLSSERKLSVLDLSEEMEG